MTAAAVLAATWLGKKAYDRLTSTELPFPPGPRGIPVFGNMFQLGENPSLKCIEWSKKYGPIFGMKMGSKYFMWLLSSIEVQVSGFVTCDYH